MSDSSGNKHWTESFRVVTPILVTISIFLLGAILSTVSKLDDKVFKHLTNDEIHAPRSMYTTKGDFEFYQKYRDAQIAKLDSYLCRIENLLMEHMNKNN
jgi:hypothetical protein